MEAQPWWAVDISSDMIKVTYVVILNRGDCCGGRLGNFVIALRSAATLTDEIEVLQNEVRKYSIPIEKT